MFCQCEEGLKMSCWLVTKLFSSNCTLMSTFDSALTLWLFLSLLLSNRYLEKQNTLIFVWNLRHNKCHRQLENGNVSYIRRMMAIKLWLLYDLCNLCVCSVYMIWQDRLFGVQRPIYYSHFFSSNMWVQELKFRPSDG